MNIKSNFGKKKIIIGIAHFSPLPGFSFYDDSIIENQLPLIFNIRE